MKDVNKINHRDKKGYYNSNIDFALDITLIVVSVMGIITLTICAPDIMRWLAECIVERVGMITEQLLEYWNDIRIMLGLL